MGKKVKWMIPVSRMAPTAGGNPLTAVAAVPQPPPGMPPMPAAPPPTYPQMPPMAAQGGSLDPLSVMIMTLNANPYMIGALMLVLNLGGRFLSLELTKKQEAFLQASWVRPFIFFTLIFISTRNIVAAFWVTILFFFVIWVVVNENSKFCMIPSWCDPTTVEKHTTYETNVGKLRAIVDDPVV
jgi:hypothetical protein